VRAQHRLDPRRLRGVAYDAVMAAAERAGLRDERRGLVALARGATVEIGAGTGRNLEHYGPEVTRLVLVEPDQHMARPLRRRAALARPDAEIVRAVAARLPFADASFDTAVVTAVLCTVPDQTAALAEIWRVLRPGGALLFGEHVRSDDPRLAAWQDRLLPLWRLLGDGCEPNRRTLEAIEGSPLRVDWVRRGSVPGAPAIVRPMIVGAALRGAGEG
jgi:ubiquinone/menaquinone biosynthesis C-methylase UbiE